MHSDNNGRVPEIKGKNKKKSVENINETHEPAKAKKCCKFSGTHWVLRATSCKTVNCGTFPELSSSQTSNYASQQLGRSLTQHKWLTLPSSLAFFCDLVCFLLDWEGNFEKRHTFYEKSSGCYVFININRSCCQVLWSTKQKQQKKAWNLECSKGSQKMILFA